MLSEAEQRGDLFCSAMSRLANCNAVWLVEDNPDEARRNVESAMAAWHGRDFSLQHILSEMALVQADLYQRRGDDAWRRAEAFWSPARRFRNVAASGDGRRMPLAARASRTGRARSRANPTGIAPHGRKRRARYLERKPFEWCPAVARVVRAAIAFQTGNRAQAASWLAESARQLDDCSMPLLAAVCRYRFGQLVGAEAGRQVMDAVQQWMQDKSIAAPDAMAAMLAPGFDGE